MEDYLEFSGLMSAHLSVLASLLPRSPKRDPLHLHTAGNIIHSLGLPHLDTERPSVALHASCQYWHGNPGQLVAPTSWEQ
ncbi:uncharacterized protein N7498_005364 [Penicillium cinerascens]|uniref:Uncharacterized protein n=1 Tax=Penicillium cinerascens TaxID=70096 RepID=A0A9W9T0H2_9EURO|nr:uncharacterized protein N7498_005364 [Penicillium cinerascens]KAJ5204485.1 hypothetical protein N7498_005364 [Penicillium cinerascens]